MDTSQDTSMTNYPNSPIPPTNQVPYSLFTAPTQNDTTEYMYLDPDNSDPDANYIPSKPRRCGGGTPAGAAKGHKTKAKTRDEVNRLTTENNRLKHALAQKNSQLNHIQTNFNTTLSQRTAILSAENTTLKDQVAALTLKLTEERDTFSDRHRLGSRLLETYPLTHVKTEGEPWAFTQLKHLVKLMQSVPSIEAELQEEHDRAQAEFLEVKNGYDERWNRLALLKNDLDVVPEFKGEIQKRLAELSQGVEQGERGDED